MQYANFAESPDCVTSRRNEESAGRLNRESTVQRPLLCMFVKEVLQQKTIGFVMVGGSILFCCSGLLMIPMGFGGVFRGTYTREPVTDRITDAGTLNLVPMLFLFMTLGVIMALGGLGMASGS